MHMCGYRAACPNRRSSRVQSVSIEQSDGVSSVCVVCTNFLGGRLFRLALVCLAPCRRRNFVHSNPAQALTYNFKNNALLWCAIVPTLIEVVNTKSKQRNWWPLCYNSLLSMRVIIGVTSFAPLQLLSPLMHQL